MRMKCRQHRVSVDRLRIFCSGAQHFSVMIQLSRPGLSNRGIDLAANF